MNFLHWLVGTAVAQGGTVPDGILPGEPPRSIPEGTNGLPGLAQDIVNIGFTVAGGITLIVIVVLGYNMFTSKGNDAEFKKALTGVLYAAIGLLVMGISYLLVRTLLTLQFN